MVGKAAVVGWRWSLLFAKRLERERFICPKAESGTVRLRRAQLSMLFCYATPSLTRLLDWDYLSVIHNLSTHHRQHRFRLW